MKSLSLYFESGARRVAELNGLTVSDLYRLENNPQSLVLNVIFKKDVFLVFILVIGVIFYYVQVSC